MADKTSKESVKSAPAKHSPKNIIEIRRLVKKFGDFTALDGVDLSVKEGEIFGLLGPNGAGKTTIINVVLSLLKQTSGTVSVNGLDNMKKAEEIKSEIGMMTQETVVESELTARENLRLFARLYHVDPSLIEKRVEERLEEADLVAFGDVKAGTFSGGMQRRLALVKSMIHEPSILILDEPTTGLDVQNRTNLWQRIKDMNKKGITIIMTTQYLEEADALCDRIAIIDHGKIKAIGTASELKAMVGTGNVLEVVVKPEDTNEVVKLLKKFGLEPIVKVDRVTAALGKESSKMFNKITNTLEDERIEVLAISAHLPTLDDVFLKLTGSQLRDTTSSDNPSAMTRARMGIGK